MIILGIYQKQKSLGPILLLLLYDDLRMETGTFISASSLSSLQHQIE